MGESLTALYLQNPQLAALLRRQAFSQQLGKEATSFEPIQSPWQGVAKLANAGLAAMLMNKEDEGINSFLNDQKKQESDWNAQVQAVRNPGGQPQAPQQTPPMAAALMGKPLGNSLDSVPAAPPAIHQIESSGSMQPGIYGDGGKAAGPMQVHPGALADVNKRFGTNYTHADLSNNPEIGKKVGDAYYGILLEQFGGDPVKAAAAYNAGSGRVAAAIQAYGPDWQKGLPQGGQDYVKRFQDGTPANQPQLGNNPNNDVMAKIQPQLKQAEDLRNLALAASNSPNPKIRAQASLLSSQAEHVQSQALAMLKFSEGQQLLSPDVEAQKVRIANAGRPTTDQRVEVNSGNKQADLILGNHNDVLQRIQQNQAIEGGFQAAETAMNGFEPGAGAAMRGDWEKAKAYLGLPNNADSAAVMNKVQADLKLAASGIMKGQGSITESERMLLQQSVDLLGNSPEGAKLVMQMIRSVHQRDQQLAQIYEKELDDSGGKPRLAEVSRAIRGLGPVVPSDVVGQLRARVEAAKGNAPQQPQGAPQGVAPRDGATATGPNGQKIILRNGQWVPMQ